MKKKAEAPVRDDEVSGGGVDKRRNRDAPEDPPAEKKGKRKIDEVSGGGVSKKHRDAPEDPPAEKEKWKIDEVSQPEQDEGPKKPNEPEPEPVPNADDEVKPEDETKKKKKESKKKQDPLDELLSLIRQKAFSELFERFLPPALAARALRKKKKIAALAHPELLEAVYERHKQIVQCFEGLTALEARDQLSRPELYTELQLPSLKVSKYGPPRTFEFVGRQKFRELPALITGRKRIKNMGGFPGRGKSYLLAAMACYLHTYEEEHEPVVYIQTSKVIGKFEYLVGALLLAYIRHPAKLVEILVCAGTSKKAVLKFCVSNEPLVLMDEVNQLDFKEEKSPWGSLHDRDVARGWLDNVIHRGISCASYNSTFQPDIDSFDVRLDDPFTLDELAAWQSCRGLYGENHRDLFFYTGYVPRFLEEYIENKEGYITRGRSFLRKFLRSNSFGEKEELLVRRILSAEVISLEGLDPTLFCTMRHQEDVLPLVHVLPFLEEQMRSTLDKNRTAATYARDQARFSARKHRFHVLMLGDTDRGVQPVAALNGLLAEWIAREFIILHRKCLKWSFASTVIFREHNGKVLELATTQRLDLEKGVCFVPFTAQAEDADLHVVKLKGKTLKVHSIQMSVSSWRKKKTRESHQKWEQSLQQLWKYPECVVQGDYTYILSNARFDEVTTNVSKQKFSDVDKSLRFIDELRDPEVELQHCRGKRKDGSNCLKTKYVGEGDVYYCHHHEPK